MRNDKGVGYEETLKTRSNRKKKYVIVRMRVIHHELKLMVEGIRDTYILSPVSWEDSRKP